MLKTEYNALNYLIHHEPTSIGHLNQTIQKLDLPPVWMLKNKLNIQIFLFETVEVLSVVLQV